MEWYESVCEREKSSDKNEFIDKILQNILPWLMLQPWRQIGPLPTLSKMVNKPAAVLAAGAA